ARAAHGRRPLAGGHVLGRRPPANGRRPCAARAREIRLGLGFASDTSAVLYPESVLGGIRDSAPGWEGEAPAELDGFNRGFNLARVDSETPSHSTAFSKPASSSSS